MSPGKLVPWSPCPFRLSQLGEGRASLCTGHQGAQKSHPGCGSQCPAPHRTPEAGLWGGPVVVLLRMAPRPNSGHQGASKAGPSSWPSWPGWPGQLSTLPPGPAPPRPGAASASSQGPSTGMQPAPRPSPGVPGLPPVFNVSACSRQAAPRVPCSMGCCREQGSCGLCVCACACVCACLWVCLCICVHTHMHLQACTSGYVVPYPKQCCPGNENWAKGEIKNTRKGKKLCSYTFTVQPNQ